MYEGKKSKCLVTFALFLAFFLLSNVSSVSATDIQLWRGQYYTGSSWNTGTYTFNFTIYDASIGGNSCYTNTTSITTDSIGYWETLQYNVLSSCNNASIDYYLNINIAGSDQPPRRLLQNLKYADLSVDNTFSGNVDVVGNITVTELNVTSGDTLYLSFLALENEGHYSSVNTNWIIEESDQPSAFLGVYADNGSIMTNAHLILEAGGSSAVFTKNSPLHPLSANSSGWINEDGNIGIFVHHGEDIIFFHYDSLVKDEFGNILSLQDAERLVTLNDTGLILHDGNYYGDGSQLTGLDYYTDADIDGTESAFIGWDKNSSNDFSGNWTGAIDMNVIGSGQTTEINFLDENSVERAIIEFFDSATNGSFKIESQGKLGLYSEGRVDVYSVYGDLILDSEYDDIRLFAQNGQVSVEQTELKLDGSPLRIDVGSAFGNNSIDFYDDDNNELANITFTDDGGDGSLDIFSVGLLTISSDTGVIITNLTGLQNYTHLSNFTDDLGDRGYTSLSNFTNDVGYSVGNHTVDTNRSDSEINALIDGRVVQSYVEGLGFVIGNHTVDTNRSDADILLVAGVFNDTDWILSQGYITNSTSFLSLVDLNVSGVSNLGDLTIDGNQLKRLSGNMEVLAEDGVMYLESYTSDIYIIPNGNSIILEDKVVIDNGDLNIDAPSLGDAFINFRDNLGAVKAYINFTDDVGDGSTEIFSKGHLTITAEDGISFNGNILQPFSNLAIVGSYSSGVYMDGVQHVDVVGKYAYVTAFDENSLTILDISDSTNPVFVGWLKDNSNLNGATGVQVVGGYAYVTTQYANSLAIVDVSDPSSPTFKGSVTGLGTPVGLYVSGKYAYVPSTAQDRLYIIDITDPTNPTTVGTVTNSTYMNFASDVHVYGEYAYVSGYSSNSLAVVDVSNPTSPSVVGGLINITYMQSARGVYSDGRYAYVAGYISDSLAIIDISNPASPTMVGGVSTGLNGADSIHVFGDYAYVTEFVSNALSVVDVSDPTNPTIVATQGGFTGAVGLDINGKYAYVVENSVDTLSVVDLGGIDSHVASFGAVSTSILDVLENAQVGNDLYVGNGLVVGNGGIYSRGSASFANNTLSVDNGIVNINGDLGVNSLAGSYTNGSAYACVYNNGTFFASEVDCP